MKNYLIIGASKGIGKALAEQLSAHSRVYATYNTEAVSHNTIQYQHLNVMDQNFTFSNLPESLDGLIYCPGSINLKPFGRITPADFAADYQLQVLGAISSIQQVLPLLKKGTNPSIVLFSTVAVQTGFPFHAQVAASKGAIEGLVKSLSAELAPTIRINAIAPSLTQTPLAAQLVNTPEKLDANAQRHPLKKIGTAEEVASLAEFLLSDKAAWITGQIIHIDGGMGTIKM
jgi:NAD(P)-dependent dehydrogenase (short-subunit alcohol dehydrogenase family)